MKLRACIPVLLLASLPLVAQEYNPRVRGYIDQTDIDSLVAFVRVLSGEDSVTVAGERVLIGQRSDFSGKQLAAEYISATLLGYGLDVRDQIFSGDGRNVYAVQPGTLHPSQYYLICAHYDAVTSHCADDNASGVAGVLEAARILSSHAFDHTIIYALWDKEEIGLVGSAYYASKAYAYRDEILGVVNLDMIGWNGTGDGHAAIHTRNIGNSDSLATLMMGIDSVYSNPLTPGIVSYGTDRSDHASFWSWDYGAILLIEESLNPDYHRSTDRIDKFNTAYFHNMSKLAVGTISTLALGNPVVAVGDEDGALPVSFGVVNYPNPFNASTVIVYDLPAGAHTRIGVYTVAGRKVADLVDGDRSPGRHRVVFDAGSLSSGMYLVRLQADGTTRTGRMMLLK